MRNAMTRYDFLIPDFSDQLVAGLAVIYENGLDLRNVLFSFRIGLVHIRVQAGHDFARRLQPEPVCVIQYPVGNGAHQDQQEDEKDHNNPGIVHFQGDVTLQEIGKLLVGECQRRGKAHFLVMCVAGNRVMDGKVGNQIQCADKEVLEKIIDFHLAPYSLLSTDMVLGGSRHYIRIMTPGVSPYRYRTCGQNRPAAGESICWSSWRCNGFSETIPKSTEYFK
jgi:hypothetical protein